jgi:mono/diheme cytochrome c family protein
MLSLALGALGLLRATEVSIELPPETATYKDAPGAELARSFCVQCHSVEYTAIQPPMPRKFWEAEVAKMRDKYYAPVPKEMDAKLVDYLLKAYGAEK